MKNNAGFMDNCYRGIPWGVITERISETISPEEIGRNDKAYKMVRPVITIIFGEETIGWDLERRNTSSGKIMTFVKAYDKK